MATNVEVFALTDYCSQERNTGIQVSNGDRLQINCDASDTWILDTADGRNCNADGHPSYAAVYIPCDGLTQRYGKLCGKLGSVYFPVGLSYDEIITGLSSAQMLYLYCHDAPVTDNAGSITAIITVTSSQPANAIMFSCNT